MTETTTTETVEIDTAPGNVTPDREMRHQIRHLVHRACDALTGEPGLTQEQQIERATVALMAAETAVERLTTLRTLLVNRDFEKFQATRDRDAEKKESGPNGGVMGFLVVAMGDPDSDGDDEDDESSSDLTQD